MKPIRFRLMMHVLGAGPGRVKRYSTDIESIEPLPVWTDGEKCVSCWQMSLRERLSALCFGRVWLSVLSGRSQPPVHLQACRTYFRELKADDRS